MTAYERTTLFIEMDRLIDKIRNESNDGDIDDLVLCIDSLKSAYIKEVDTRKLVHDRLVSYVSRRKEEAKNAESVSKVS